MALKLSLCSFCFFGKSRRDCGCVDCPVYGDYSYRDNRPKVTVNVSSQKTVRSD